MEKLLLIHQMDDDYYYYWWYGLDNFWYYDDFAFEDDGDDGLCCTAFNYTDYNGFTSLNLYNRISGSLPPEIGKLTRLVNMSIAANSNMTGSIPTQIGL